MAEAPASKVVVVTGSTRGIGRAIAEASVAAGHDVVISSRKPEAVASALAELGGGEAGAPNVRGAVAGIPADVSREGDLRALFDLALERFGRIDMWVNNAGISLGYKPLDESSPRDIRRIVDINLTGTALGMALVIPHFRRHGGQILNLTGRGHQGDATPFTALYAATKIAIASLTRSVAAENRRYPLSVNALVPGMVATDFYTDIEISPRMGEASENWRYALDAFGVPAESVGAKVVEIVAKEPGCETGRIYSLMTPARIARGMVKITGHRMSGRIKPEP